MRESFKAVFVGAWMLVCVWGVATLFVRSPQGTLPTGFVSVWLAAAVGGVAGLVVHLAKRVQRQARKRREDAAAKESHKLSLQASLSQSNRDCVTLFGGLPAMIAATRYHQDQAIGHFNAGVYPYFWSSIDLALGALSAYRSSLERLTVMANQHNRWRGALAVEFDLESDELAFPIGADAVAALTVGQEAAEELARIAYEAMKVTECALIWEQRRTTKAVQSGFQSLESAVRQTQQMIAQGCRSLHAAISYEGERTRRQVVRSAASIQSDIAFSGFLTSLQVSALSSQVAASTAVLSSSWRKA